jgi:uncharacterized membrane protein
MNTKIRSFLIVSLLLNILFTGIVAGHFLKVKGRFAAPPPIDADEFNLSNEQLLQIQNQLHAAHLANQETFELIRKEKNKALQVLRAKPFDKVAFQARIDEINRLNGITLQQVSETVKQMAPTLNDNERAALAVLLRNPPPVPPDR